MFFPSWHCITKAADTSSLSLYSPLKLGPLSLKERGVPGAAPAAAAALSLMCHAAEWYNTKNVVVLLVSLYIVEMLDGLLQSQVLWHLGPGVELKIHSYSVLKCMCCNMGALEISQQAICVSKPFAAKLLQKKKNSPATFCSHTGLFSIFCTPYKCTLELPPL